MLLAMIALTGGRARPLTGPLIVLGGRKKENEMCRFEIRFGMPGKVYTIVYNGECCTRQEALWEAMDAYARGERPADRTFRIG